MGSAKPKVVKRIRPTEAREKAMHRRGGSRARKVI